MSRQGVAATIESAVPFSWRRICVFVLVLVPRLLHTTLEPLATASATISTLASSADHLFCVSHCRCDLQKCRRLGSLLVVITPLHASFRCVLVAPTCASADTDCCLGCRLTLPGIKFARPAEDPSQTPGPNTPNLCPPCWVPCDSLEIQSCTFLFLIHVSGLLISQPYYIGSPIPARSQSPPGL
jgi:hypothetical protein